MSPAESPKSSEGDLYRQIQSLDADLEPSAQSRDQVLGYAKEQLAKPNVSPHGSPSWALPMGLLAALVMCAGIYAQMAEWIGIKGGSGSDNSSIVTQLDAPIIIELLPARSAPENTGQEVQVEDETQSEPAARPWFAVARMQPATPTTTLLRNGTEAPKDPKADQIDCSEISDECADTPIGRR